MLNRLRNNSLFTIVFSLFLWTPFAGFGQNPIEEIKQEAQAAKLTTDLLNIQQEAQQKMSQKSKNLRQAASPDTKTGLTRVSLMQEHDGLIAIEAVSNEADGQALLSSLQALGMQEGRFYKRIVFGYFPIDQLGQLKNVSTLHVAQPAYAAFTNVGNTTSQGDRAMKADIARQNFNVTGAGSKVGIISDSYNSLRGAPAGVASGDLPPNVQVIKDSPARLAGTDEGRAMAEIIHDVAPGANIAFNTGYETKIDFALGILNLAAAGCNIIVDDLIYFTEPFFQDGILAQVVDEVVKSGKVTYFSAAGNYARQSYASGFRNSGKPAPGLSLSDGHAHDFVGNGTLVQKVVVPPGGRFYPIFQWRDPYYSESILSGGVSGAKTDMDIYVYYQGELDYFLSSFNSNIGVDPIERPGYLTVNNTNQPIELEIALVKYDGPDPSLMKWIDIYGSATVQFATQSSTLWGHANAEKAIAVGAVRWSRTPVYDPVNYPIPVIETFSAAGGTPILFTEYGQPIPSTVRLKPEISAANGGNTTFFGQVFPGGDGDNFPNFFGTSAAAPHAAAVAALLQEKAKLSMSPADVLKRLETTAIDMDDPLTPGFDVGFDFRTGYGFIQADKALMFGTPLVVLEPIYDCQTGRITLQTSGGDGSPITFSVPGVMRTAPTSTTGIVEAGIRNDPKPIVIVATQSGVSVSFTFNIVEYCSRPKVLTLLEPLYECATGRITLRTVGGDGSPITFTVPGVMRSSLTDPNGIVEAGLRNDPKPLMITAMQSGVTVTYVFNFGAYCGSRARLIASEPGSGLQVTTLGNPVAADWVEVEVKGAQGQALKLQVNNTLGEVTSQKAVELSESVERHKLSLGGVPGLYFLQVSTPAQSKTIKVIRH